MIYNKKANFPYPLLINNTKDYLEPRFEFDVELSESHSEFILNITCEINSQFIKQKIRNKEARLLLIIKSIDNQFFELDDVEHNTQKILKSRLSLSSKTTIQLMIQAINEIGFTDNQDISDFYKEFSREIVVDKGMALGFSNIIIFDGSHRNPYDLFEKKVDETIESDIKIELTDETILIVYKNDAIQFSDFPQSRNLNNLYLYTGLQKALIIFLIRFAEESAEDGVDIREIDEMQCSPLEEKLLSLMRSKNIDKFDLTTIDSVIYSISDDIVTKYVETVRGLSNEN